MVGINERGSRRYVLMIIAQQSSEMAIASYLSDPSTGGSKLMEIICERENMRRALKRVRSNKGAPGVDSMTVDQLPSYMRRHWPQIKEELLNGTYKPFPVRRKEIQTTARRCPFARYPYSTGPVSPASSRSGTPADLGTPVFWFKLWFSSWKVSA
jgi:hypothetical protein